MDNALGPREIQARIRSGRSVDEVAEVAGLPLDKVERFAAPVLAEREYIAQQAMGAPVRRRGETSGHRKLRVALAERLTSRHVDIDEVTWDSARMEDGRWAVIATVRVEEEQRRAIFHYDVMGRFSVAGNDDARWVLGERSAGTDADDEPTIDLNDDLAIVRSVSGAATGQTADDATGAGQDNVVALRGGRAAAAPTTEPTMEGPTMQGPVMEEPTTAEPTADEGAAESAQTDGDATTDAAAEEHTSSDGTAGASDTPALAAETGGLDILYDILDRAGTEFTEDSVEILRREAAGRESSAPPSDATAPATETGPGQAGDTPADSAPEGPAGAAPGSAAAVEETPGPQPSEPGSADAAAADAENSTDEPTADEPNHEPAAEDQAGRSPAGEDPVVEDLAGEDSVVQDPAEEDLVVEDLAGDATDAAAVPDTSAGAFEAAAPQPEYPVEPSLFDDDPEVAAQLAAPTATPRTEHVVGTPDLAPAAPADATDEPADAMDSSGPTGSRPTESGPAPDDETTAPAQQQPADDDQVTDVAPEAAQPAQPSEVPPPEPTSTPGDAAASEATPPVDKPAPKKRSRKRASVPSWDEIMFGSPRSKR